MTMRWTRRLLAVLWLGLLPALGWAQFEVDWVRTSTGLSGQMLALDAANNAYSVGSDISRMTVLKHSAAGVLQWQRTISGASAARGVWVATDTAGNALVIGNQVSASSGAAMGIIVAKFSPAGDLLWQDSIVQSLAYALRVATDAAGNVFVLGSLPILDGTTAHVLYKYAPDGTRLWKAPQTFRSPLSMALAPNGRVLVSGYAAGALMVVEAYDGATGNRLWGATLPSSSGGQDIAVGPQGEFVAVGQVGPGPTGTLFGFLVVKYDAAFNELWRKTYTQGDVALRVALDGSGNTVVAGRVGNYFDWMTLKLDPAGAVLWSRRQNLHLYNDEIVNSLVLGPDGSVYLAGQGGPGPTSGTVSTTQAVVSRYASADGAQQGFYASLPGARAMAARLGSDGAVYMVAAGEQAVHRIRQGGAGISAIDNWPVAKAAAVSATSGAAPLAVSFSSAGSMDPDGTGIFTQWDFGDGSSSTLADPTHTYGTAGSFAATLTVTDFVGHAVKASPVVVTVTSAPPVAARPSALNFSATSVVGGTPVQATVVLTSTAGATVALRSSSSSVRVPASVVVPAGSDRASFTITTSRVKRTTSATLTATANGGSVRGTLTVTR